MKIRLMISNIHQTNSMNNLGIWKSVLCITYNNTAITDAIKVPKVIGPKGIVSFFTVNLLSVLDYIILQIK
ncbi:MAG: hypothetical protein A2644_03855 [Candidatus Zambryskibacteria bacterium RIFCSPHIGHO2_01_FULL_39_63]|nr:MAG: hypothetical protein A2644_03855 [Candidatus Zambryskibacteria bacterium RIFCSPHIGHO2_01_FULL_39_63]